MNPFDWWNDRSPEQKKAMIVGAAGLLAGCLLAALRGSKGTMLASVPVWGEPDTPSHYFDYSEIFDTDIFG